MSAVPIHAPVWRNTVCTGCKERCRYRDLKGTSVSWQDAYMARYRASKDAAEAGDYSKRVSRGNILGMMHEVKREYWLNLVSTCPGRVLHFEGPYDEVLGAGEARLPYHPVKGTRRQRAFLDQMVGVFTLVDAREVMPALSAEGVQKFVYRLIGRELVERVSHGHYRATHLNPEHVCAFFEAILVEKNIYQLTCTKCGRVIRTQLEEAAPF
jgi:hypothetical protein